MKKKITKKVGNYKLMELIGRGASANVYLSIDEKKNQLVAVKCMPKDQMDKEHGQKNLKRELEILHKIKHPNIVSIKNYFENKNNHYIVLEYCNGGDLTSYTKEYIKETKHPLNEFYIQKILQQLAPALEYMHSNKIIHRDIKLQNILLNFDTFPNIPKNGNLPPKIEFKDMSLNKSFSIKIADLGYAKDLVKDSEGTTILGSPLYMSPDIVEKYTDTGKEDKKYNTSVDLWSLGVITYELLTGTQPFLGKTYDEVFKNIKKGIYKLPKNLKPSIEIISFINGLLQYFPEKRLNWTQIKSHPFLTKNPKDFNYIDLELISENEKEAIQINSKDSDNLLWIFFKCKNANMKIDKMNNKEAEKPEVKKIIDKNKVINEEVQKALEQEKLELEKEKQRIKEMRAKAQEDKKKAELEKINRKKEQEKLINDENNIKDLQQKLIKETEKGKKNSDENNKKLKELEIQLQQIKNDKENLDIKLKNVEQKISETEKIKNFAEKQINEITKGTKNLNNEEFRKQLDKLHKEKIEKENEMKKLKEEQKLKENNYKNENDKLQKKMEEILNQKKLLEKEVNENNNTIKDKIKNTNDQMLILQDEIKKIEEEKKEQIKKIQKDTENLEKQINEYSRVIKQKENEEKEMENKGIFNSCVDISMEDFKKEEGNEKEKNEDKEKEKDKNKEKEKEKKNEKVDDDEWEEIGENDIVSINEDLDVDIEQMYDDDFEIIEAYVDNETAKNEGK